MVRGGGTGSTVALICKLCRAVVAVGKMRHTGGTGGCNGGTGVTISFAVFSSASSRCVSPELVVTVIGACTVLGTVDTVNGVEMCGGAAAWDKDGGHEGRELLSALSLTKELTGTVGDACIADV